MRGSARRRALGLVGTALVIAACTYDFDDYVADGASSDGASLTGGSGGDRAGDAGVPPALGGTGGVATETGGTGGAAPTTGEGGDSGKPGGASGEAGGVRGDAGEGSGEAGGGSAEAGAGGADAGGAGSVQGGSANGGSLSGGTGSAGSASGGSATAGSGGASGGDCDALNGVVFEGHCYFYVSALLDWSAAESECAEASGTLVAVNSEAEQRFLESTFFAPANDAWIGLSLESLSTPPGTCKLNPDACPFRWLTEEALTYTKWARHSASDVEPNYTGACVRIQAATLDWADQGCSERLRAICEVP